MFSELEVGGRKKNKQTAGAYNRKQPTFISLMLCTAHGVMCCWLSTNKILGKLDFLGFPCTIINVKHDEM